MKTILKPVADNYLCIAVMVGLNVLLCKWINLVTSAAVFIAGQCCCEDTGLTVTVY
jgi:hypothetical protein